MNKILIGFILSISLIALLSEGGYCSERKLLSVDIAGKILDKDGKEISEDVTLIINISKHKDDASNMYGFVEIKETLELKSQGSRFSWKGEANSVSVSAKKEGYYSTIVNVPLLGGPDVVNEKYVFTPFKLSAKDMLIYLIQKGTGSTLEYTSSAQIPYDETGKIKYGWSFDRRWYFPSTEEDIDIIFTVDENDRNIYTMKEPGGFIYFPGYPEFESQQNRPWADFDFMPQAPESGYIQSISPEDYKIQQESQGVYYYFKTPTGKYGKIKFPGYGGYFDYYLQPDGSRNLEVEKFWYKPPLNPKAEHMPDDPVAYPANE